MPDDTATTGDGGDITTADTTTETKETTAETPEWASRVPKKFHRDTFEETMAAWDKSYNDLERALAERQSRDGLKIDPDKPGKTIESTTDIIKKAGYKVADLEAYYLEHGKLSDDHYEAFAKQGYGRKFVDETIDARYQAARMKNEALRSAMANHVGGTENLEVLLAQAKSLPEDVRQSFNALVGVNGATATQAVHAISIIQQAVEKAGIKRDSGVDTTNTPAKQPKAVGFKTYAEWSNAQAEIARAYRRGAEPDKDLVARSLATPPEIKRRH